MNTHVLSALLIALSLIVSGCTKEGSIPQVPDAQIEMIIDRYPGSADSSELTNISYFIYEEDRLIEITDKYRKWVLEYEDDRISIMTESDNNEPEWKRIFNLEYDRKGQLKMLDHAECRSGHVYPFHHKVLNFGSRTYTCNYEFYSSKKTRVAGNLVRVLSFDDDGSLSARYFHKYDDQYNYQKLDPRSITHGGFFNKNNEVEWRYEDYIGLIDTACNPCETSYTYNADGLPTFIEYSWGGSREIIYR